MTANDGLKILKRKRAIAVFFFIVCGIIGHSEAQSFTPMFLDNIEKKYGLDSKKRLIAWEKFPEEYKNANDNVKLEEVNRFFNLLEYKTDLQLWRKEDYWATPLELLVAGAGDCEDFTLAKYFTLLKLGIPDEKLLITYVTALDLDQAHMVLTYYATPHSIPLVLDNLNKEILPADQRKDLLPIYSFNAQGLWQAKKLGVGNKVGRSSDLKKWVELEERMKLETIGTFY